MSDFQDPLVVDPANGVVRGDSGAMPNRGTGTGMVGSGAPYGADIGQNATNRMGRVGDTGSDPMDKEWADDERQTMRGSKDPEGGRKLTGTDSDPPGDDSPGDPTEAGESW